MNRVLLFLCFVFLPLITHAANVNNWQWHEVKTKSDDFQQATLFKLDTQRAASDLMTLVDTQQHFRVNLPDGQGGYVEYLIWHDSIMAPQLQSKYPMIRSFAGYQSNATHNTGRFDLGPNGFFAFYHVNNTALYLDPSNDLYRLYQKASNNTLWQDEVRILSQSNMPLGDGQKRGPLIGNGGSVEMVTYRLAVTTSDEYTTFYGGKTQALNGIVTTINRVNQIYQTDIAVKLELVANNDTLIFTANDPYDNGNLDDTLSEVQSQIDTLIGSANYDVGHLMATSGAGLAALGVICANGAKAQGMTGIATPQGDAFDVDYVAHELGHQFGANHTYNGSDGSCTTRAADSAYEPGSGITIMAYAGICGSENLASNSIAMFHSRSIDEINTHLTQSSGATCGTLTDNGNKAPIADAKDDHTIPINTPFMLTGAATDANSGDTLSYAWEQLDLGSQTSNSTDLKDNGNGPMFRPYLPSASATRYFPLLADVISGQVTKGDGYPTTDRTMTFRFVVRDGKGGVSFDTAQVTTVSAAGPFTITAPDENTTAGDNNQITVSWNVANTDQTPVSCSSVNIMQTNSDATQTQVLVANTPNDGQQQVTLFGSESNKARVMVQCASSVFYALSKEFELATTLAVTSQQAISVAEDNSVTLQASQFSVVNQQAGSQLTLTVLSGSNYSFSENTVTPASNFNGELSVNISLTDGTTTTSYPAKVSVTAVNDAPQIVSQQALSVKEDETITLGVAQFEVVDVDSSVFTLTIETGDNYTLEANVVRPQANFNGLLQVPITISDQQGANASFMAQITVAAVNDAPVASNDTVSAVSGTSTTFNVLANDSDIDGDSLTISDIIYEGTGTASISGSVISYQSASGFTGQEQLVYTIADASGEMAQATVTINVQAQPVAPPTNNLDSGSGGGGSFGYWIYVLSLCLMFRRFVKGEGDA
ncbi:tandem-95 repeat protein [Pseudoalteromonas sp. JBTF-M23]|uniref:Tandem-95 repeat protein n=1 Tax=Pseudoalteromonas caenipelagi TaxID=2726988 RepID=A0A849V9U1_9GAMM|nr:tandem-95 repeat protein [Pseudoalteromonas caenipelagi]NOU50016.1 tandem-95 repeat protein [Pseudoalteromonas caenipelagi]